MSDTASTSPQSQSAPYPGSHEMPQWNVGELIDTPRFQWKNLFAFLGPGILMGGAAIGGGEWLTGPLTTAKFGGGLMWLATASIISQVFYNIEISRYTLYTGEPIFTGKFRTPPGPRFWLFMYLLLDFGSIFPYLAASCAVPCAALILGKIPNPETNGLLLNSLSYGIFLACFLPLIFGGKIYSALKAIMTVKIVVVMGFLLILSFAYSTPATWWEIGTGFFKVGNVPIKRGEDVNGNKQLDPGEDWDKDGRLDHVEPETGRRPPLDTDGDGIGDSWHDITGDGQPDRFMPVKRTIPPKRPGDAEKTVTDWWPDLNGDGVPEKTILVDADFDGIPEKEINLDPNGTGVPVKFIDIDDDKTIDGDNVSNYIGEYWSTGKFPIMDMTMIAVLSALVSISGQGGLSNTPISNYTRDQGWGMGHHVGAIPSVVGGQDIQLSHEGTVFIPTAESLPRWKRWYYHIVRDQAFVWAPACFFGIALPSMLSVQFLKRGFAPANEYETAVMTAEGLRDFVGGSLGQFCWVMTVVCGVLVLLPTAASTIDGIVRRWVDVFWTSSPTLRKMESGAIRYVYFAVLAVYCVFGLVMLSMAKPLQLLMLAGMIYNFALGFSSWHTLWLNNLLLPKPLRPGWFMSLGLFTSGLFFWSVASLSAYVEISKLLAG